MPRQSGAPHGRASSGSSYDGKPFLSGGNTQALHSILPSISRAVLRDRRLLQRVHLSSIPPNPRP